MTEILNHASDGQKTRKIIFQMASGAIVGAAVTYALLTSLGSARLDIDDPGRISALAVGIMFALISVMVGFGAMAPKTGAHFLNVENADELREQRRSLWRGSGVMLLIGVALLLLALAVVDGSKGLFSREVTAIVVGLCVLAITGLSLAGRGDNDELMKAVGNEASALAMYVTLIGFGIWAALTHLGYVAWIEPLGMLSALLFLQLVTIMVVSARRGLLRPR